MLCLILALSSPGYAQEKRLITLDEAIAIALDQSFSRKTLGLRLDGAAFGVAAARGRFKTNVLWRLEVPTIIEQVVEERVPNELPLFNTVGTTRVQSTLDINQPLPTDGVITLRSTFFHRKVSTFLESLNQAIARNEFYTSVSLRFTQPIFTFNRLKAGFERANLDLERAERQFKRTELDIVFQVTQAYFSLYRATRQVEIARAEVEQQRQSFELARKKFEAGLIPEVEALQMEVDYAQSQNSLLEAEGNLKRQEDSFKQLVGLDLLEPIRVDTRFDYTPFEIDEDKAIAEALKHRSEIRELEIDVRLAELNVREVDDRSDFRMDLVAFLDITGVSDPNLGTAGLGDLIDSSFRDLRRRPRNKGVALSVTIPVWDWHVNRNEVAQAQAQLDEATLALQEQKKTVTREVRAVISRVREARGRLEALKRSEEIAERSYQISLARFENGDISSQELALDRDRLTAARTAFLDAYIAYQVAVADLKRKTWWDFERNRSLVEDEF